MIVIVDAHLRRHRRPGRHAVAARRHRTPTARPDPTGYGFNGIAVALLGRNHPARHRRRGAAVRLPRLARRRSCSSPKSRSRSCIVIQAIIVLTVVIVNEVVSRSGRPSEPPTEPPPNSHIPRRWRHEHHHRRSPDPRPAAAPPVEAVDCSHRAAAAMIAIGGRPASSLLSLTRVDHRRRRPHLVAAPSAPRCASRCRSSSPASPACGPSACGIVNIGIEGMMIFGTWFGGWGAWQFGAVGRPAARHRRRHGRRPHPRGRRRCTFNVNHIISGVAINLLAFGGMRYLSDLRVHGRRSQGGGISQSPQQKSAIPTFDVPFLAGGDIGRLADARHPRLVREEAAGSCSATSPASCAGLIFNISWATAHRARHWCRITAWVLWRTRFGLRLRSSGEAPSAAESLGVKVIAAALRRPAHQRRLRRLRRRPTWPSSPRRTTARARPPADGFIGLATTIFGNWRPFGVLAGALPVRLSPRRCKLVGRRQPPDAVPVRRVRRAVLVLVSLAVPQEGGVRRHHGARRRCVVLHCCTSTVEASARVAHPGGCRTSHARRARHRQPAPAATGACRPCRTAPARATSRGTMPSSAAARSPMCASSTSPRW